MKPPLHLQQELRAGLPQTALEKLQQAGETAAEMGYSLFLIGGSVRDVLLQRDFGRDLDLVSETYDVGRLAAALQNRWGGSLQHFERYGTAKLRLEKLEFDFATARTEHYAYPGAPPEVSFSGLDQDLIRRDFSVNAMAVGLLPHQFGALVDPFGGWRDLQQKQLRALHAGKFREDPVRCWRAVRQAHQLNFGLEAQTRAWLMEALADGGFDGFFGTRMQRELDKVLALPAPLSCLEDLWQLGVLRCLSPRLDWPRFAAYAREALATVPSAHLPDVLLLGLLWALPADARASERLSLDRSLTQAWQRFEQLLALETDWSTLRPSEAYRLLDKPPELTLMALLAQPHPALRQAARQYAGVWRFVRPRLSGTIIKEWLPPGPLIRQILQALLNARLDGEIATDAEELALARELAARLSGDPPKPAESG